MEEAESPSLQSFQQQHWVDVRKRNANTGGNSCDCNGGRSNSKAQCREKQFLHCCETVVVYKKRLKQMDSYLEIFPNYSRINDIKWNKENALLTEFFFGLRCDGVNINVGLVWQKVRKRYDRIGFRTLILCGDLPVNYNETTIECRVLRPVARVVKCVWRWGTTR